MAETELKGEGKEIAINHLSGTWRDEVQPDQGIITKGDLIVYLNPYRKGSSKSKDKTEISRVIDRPDLGQLSLFSDLKH
jgi:hypothetical protein